MPSGSRVTVEIADGPTLDVAWHSGMNAREALELAAGGAEPGQLTFGLQYYGRQKSYFLLMINETYDTFGSSSDPSFYWHFTVDGKPAEQGIDDTVLHEGAVVRFGFQVWDGSADDGSPVGVKHRALERR